AHFPIRKSNLLMDLQNMQKSPIFRILVDILALVITPKDYAHPFVPPLTGDLVIDYVNNLGYPEELQFVSKMYVNSLYQPWRTILSMINQCLTGKTSGSDRPRHPVLQILWGVVTRTNVDYAKLIWEEFIQEIKNFFSDAANLKVPTKKPKPYVILVSPPVQEPIFTTTTTTLPPPLPQSTTDSDLSTRVSILENRSVDFEQKHQLQDKITKALASRVYKLEHHDLYSKIDKQVNEVAKEAVHNALQAPL
ncbi:hypothetical protein Tco_1027509, partial [Tanacetum coccineum]